MTTPHSPHVDLARRAIAAWLREQRVIAPGDGLPPLLRERAGVFVSLHDGDALRGCIGTIEPEQDTIADEIVVNAIRAATQDPRFPAVTSDELDRLDCKVDVLGPPEPIAGPESLDPRRYGAIVESGRRRGLLLPDLDGVDTVAQQLDICRRKAGIAPSEPVRLYRFTVTRYR